MNSDHALRSHVKFILFNRLGYARGFRSLIGNSEAMQKIYALILRVADTDSTVNICGESGTGKEVVAREIHNCSPRAGNPFVPVNCAAMPKDLLESELFGHERGAFTGAVNTRIGRFELADRGTLFLDEIGELHPSLQVKLLRAIQEREFERVGGMKTVKVDIRIITATNKDLEKAVREGTFREDLYYRLNVIPFQMPPLRRRREDIPLLIEHFMGLFSEMRKRGPLEIPPETMGSLMEYDWPGNVRELENLVERLMILDDDGVVTTEDLPEKVFHGLPADEEVRPHGNTFTEPGGISFPREGINLNAFLDQIEMNVIRQALEKAGGVKKKAAALLGLNRTTLIEKLKKRGIASSATGMAEF